MNMKPSFFDRLSGHTVQSDVLDSFDDELPIVPVGARKESARTAPASRPMPLEAELPSSAAEGQLPVDVYQTPGEIVVRAFVAGVRPDELSISISRDMVEIEGSRSEREQISSQDYFTRELFWGSFSRKILLPQEIDVEASTASAKDGLVTLVLPRLDKAKQTKLRVKAG